MINKTLLVISILIPFCFGQNFQSDLTSTLTNSDLRAPVHIAALDTSVIKLDWNNKYEEIFLTFNYQGIVNKTITVYYDEGFFFPLLELFNVLLIPYNLESGKDLINGSIGESSKSFEIDFSNQVFIGKTTELSFSYKEYFVKDFDYFVSAEFLSKAFGFNFSVDISRLTLSLISEEILPVYSKYLREQSYNFLASSDDEDKFPMLFPRERKILSGGFFDYALTGSYTKYYSPLHNYDLGVGMEFMGGDLQASINGYTIAGRTQSTKSHFRWRYAFDQNAYLSQVSVGNLVSSGINSHIINGLLLTNQPLQQRESYAKFLISEQTTPGSTIELYFNNQLIDHTSTDAAGQFRFWIPLSYASSFFKIKYYSPNGETKIVERYYQIPYTLNPPKEFNYSVEAGRIENTEKNYLHAAGVYGINDWLSNEAGIEYLNDKLFDKPFFYNSLSARIEESYLFNIFIAPSVYYKISANAVYPSLTSINLSFINYEQNLLYNPANIKNELSSNLSLPLYIDENPVNIQVNGVYQNYSSLNNYDARFHISKNIENFTPAIMYSFRQLEGKNMFFRQEFLSTSMLYAFSSVPKPFDFLYGILAGSGIHFNITSKKFESFYFNIASSITNNLRVQFDYERNIIFNVTNARVQFFLELPFTRSYTTLGNNYITTSLNGSILFNDLQKNFRFFGREQIGRVGTSFRMFLDENFNGTFDASEPEITDAQIKISSIGTSSRLVNGQTEINDLNPFTKYRVMVDETNLRNPLFAARNKFFSFEASPNYVRNFDIPFYAANEVSGNILRLIDSLKSPLAGVKVYIEGIDNKQNIITETFGDGSFYHFGLHPGKFRIYIDKKQLEFINCVSEPEEKILEIGSSMITNSFENLNFKIYAR